MRAAEIRRRRILTDIDDALADRARSPEVLEECLSVTFANGFGERRYVLVEAAKHLQDRVLVGKEDVAPHRGIGCRDTGEVAEAAGREFEYLGSRHRLHLIGRADNGVGDKIRQKAGGWQHQSGGPG